MVTLGAEWWPEPVDQPRDRETLQQYDVDPQVLERWRKARDEYLCAWAALVGQIERQGWRAPGGFVDVVFTGPPGPEPPGFVEVEDEQGAASDTASGCSATTARGRCGSRLWAPHRHRCIGA
jgi:hypothetical protein